MPSTQPQRERAEINRANAQHSTGPKTEAGKQRVALNALRHGLTGQTVVMPDEDMQAYQDFVVSFFNDLKPKGVLEQQLVQSLADDSWRLNRAKALETNLFTLGMVDHSDLIDVDDPEANAALAVAKALEQQTKALATLSMHQNRIARQFERALNQLREIQAERRSRENGEMREAFAVLHSRRIAQRNQAEAHAADPTQPAPQPYDPAADGFEFSLAEIEAWSKRYFRKEQAFAAAYPVRAAA